MQTKDISKRPWPMIITESQIEGVKFEHHKEESLINTVLEEPKEEAKPHFFFFFFFWFLFNNPPLQWVHAIYKTWLKMGNIK